MKVMVESKEQSKIPTLHVYKVGSGAKQPVIFILHGYTRRKENYLEMAYGYAREGYYVILFDALHHGELKTKEFDQLSQVEQDSLIVEIMVETAKFINVLIDDNDANPQVDINRVALIGFSMGGNIIFQYLAQLLSERIKVAVPCKATPAWGKALARFTQSTPGAERYIDAKRIAEVTAMQPSNFPECIKDLPVLMVIGDEDPLVPIDDVMAYYRRLQQNYSDQGRICLEIQKGVGHVVAPESFRKIESWIKKYL